MGDTKPKLRILGTSVTLIEKIKLRAEQDLGIQIEYIICDPQTAQQRAILYPEQYDIYDHWFHSIDLLWPVLSIQPIEIDRIKYWNEINDLPKKGKLIKEQKIASGGVPSKRLYVQDNGTLSDKETQLISMLPLTHNVDSFIYSPELLPYGLNQQQESWSWLLNPHWAGNIAIQNDAAIGVLDLAMALQASQRIEFEDIGNLSLSEIDQMTKVLMEYKQLQHFKHFWSDTSQVYRLLGSGQVNIASIWYKTIIELAKTQKLKEFKVARPVEGYRAWFGGLALSRNVSGRTKDVAYEYLNWWLDGWAGAVMARQGLYISNPSRSRNFLKPEEWDFWYMGKPASQDLLGVDDEILIPQHHTRFGGSYLERMGHIGVWNSIMDEHNYLVRKWHGFVK